MPVSISAEIPEPDRPVSDLVPDIVTDRPLDFAATYATEQPLEFPADFDSLTPEEKEKFKAQYRFGGIKCRADIKDRTIPISKETLDLP